MPESREKLEQGIRYERGGALTKALLSYEEAAVASSSPALRSEAHRRRSGVLRSRCEWDEAIAEARESGRIALEAGLTQQHAEALNAEAGVYQALGELERAEPLLMEALDATQDTRIQGIVWQNLGFLAATRRDFDEAERCFQRSSERFREAGYVRGEVIALINSGRAALDQGKVQTGLSVCQRGLEAARQEQDLDLAAVAAMNYADALRSLDRLDEALDLASEAIGYFGTLPNRWRQVECLRLLGDIHARAGEPDVAERCYRQGLDIARQVGTRVEEDRLEERLARLKAD